MKKIFVSSIILISALLCTQYYALGQNGASRPNPASGTNRPAQPAINPAGNNNSAIPGRQTAAPDRNSVAEMPDTTPTTADPITSATYLSELEKEVVRELNRARTNPRGYAAYIREEKALLRGTLLERPGEIALRTNEGARAYDEAIAALERMSPISALAPSKGMSQAAKDHVADQGPRGTTGHNSSNGNSPFQRMNRYGSWESTAGENISYGHNIARRIVISLIVDDGVPGRGHRKNIFNPAFKVVGIACGQHRGYRYMCVQDFAGGYTEK